MLILHGDAAEQVYAKGLSAEPRFSSPGLLCTNPANKKKNMIYSSGQVVSHGWPVVLDKSDRPSDVQVTDKQPPQPPLSELPN